VFSQNDAKMHFFGSVIGFLPEIMIIAPLWRSNHRIKNVKKRQKLEKFEKLTKNKNSRNYF